MRLLSNFGALNMSGTVTTDLQHQGQRSASSNGSQHEEVRAGVVRYIRELRAYARSLTMDPVSADDLVQETVTRALAAAGQFQPGTNFKAWIFTIQRNLFFNQCRKRRLEGYTLNIDSVGARREPRMAPPQDAYLEMCDVRRAFSRLRPFQREVLMLVGPGDLSYTEAAKIVGCALGTLKSRVSRARRDLLKILDEPLGKARSALPSVVGRAADDLLPK